MLPCAVGNLIGQRLHIVGTGPGVDFLADLGLLLDVNLGVTGNTCREVGRQGDSLVKRVSVERLSMSQGCTHGLDTCTADVVERILLGERPSGSLGMGTQSEGFGVLGVELADNLGP